MAVLVVDLRIICVLGVLCCNEVSLRAAPASVTYDQRQQGEFNLQVDVNDVTMVLLPGGDFAQRHAQLKVTDHVQQILGRYAGSATESRKKHKKPVVNCTATATKPEEATAGGHGSTAATVYPETAAATPGQGNVVDVAPEKRVPAGEDSSKPTVVVPYVDPYSVTPDTPNIFFETGLRGGYLAAGHAAAAAEMVTVKTVQDRVGPAANATTSGSNVAGLDGFDESPHVVKTDSGEKPDVTSSDVLQSSDPNSAKTTGGETKFPTAAAAAAEMVAVKTVQKSTTETITVVGSVDKSAANAQPDANNADAGARVHSTKTAPVEMVAVKTMERPVFAEALKADDKPSATIDAAAATKADSKEKPTTDETVEKPTFAETSKAAKKPADAVAIEDVVTETDVTSTSVSLNRNPAEMVAMKTVGMPNAAAAEASTRVVKKPVNTAAAEPQLNRKPAEMVAMKTVAEKPSGAVSAVNFTEKSEGIVTSTKLVENKNNNNSAVQTNVVSRSAPKVTEMVAVKTVESPATVAMVKSVTPAKTTTKTGSPKTAMLSSNGSSILRKVGDRKPLPLITLEVVPPEVV